MMATVGQGGLFDPVAGIQRRDEAIRLVEANADERWFVHALSGVYDLSRTGLTFTTDDIWNYLLDSEETTHEPRALGAVMRTAQKRGWCLPTDRYMPSNRPDCHRRPIRLWQGVSPLPYWDLTLE